MLPQTTPILIPRNIHVEQIRPHVPWTYFDGASDAQGRCGAGIIINFNDHRSLKASVGIGTWTNNYAKLQTLKLLLCWLRYLWIDKVKIFGDSLNVINWTNNVQHCQNLISVPILEEITSLKSCFIDYSVYHIYRERNAEADFLSKRALQ